MDDDSLLDCESDETVGSWRDAARLIGYVTVALCALCVVGWLV